MTSPRRRSTDQSDHILRRRVPAVTAVVTAVSLGACLVLAALVLLRIGDNTSQACGAALRVRDAVQLVFEDAQKRSERNAPETRSERQRRDAQEFFDRSIRTLRDVSCTK
jgi:hypothetical protein